MKILVKSSREAFMFDVDPRTLTAWYVASFFRKRVVMKEHHNSVGTIIVGSHDEGEYIMDKLMEAVQSGERSATIDVINMPFESTQQILKKTSGEEDS